MIRLLILSVLLMSSCTGLQKSVAGNEIPYLKDVVRSTLREGIMKEAAWALQQEPVTVTAETSSRSAGGKHDFFF